MSAMTHVTETCCCGATFSYTGNTSGSDIWAKSLRAKFASEHQVCRERGRPLVMWGGDQA